MRKQAYKKDLTGQRFGHLTVLEKTDRTEQKYRVWRCRCDCGQEIFVNTKRLKNGTVTDCGCIPRSSARRGSIAEDLTGRVFGHLTVLGRAENKYGRTCWLCRCDCGNEKAVTARDLKAGKVKSCGCRSHEHGHNRVDLTGRKFGRLTALRPTDRRDRKGSVYWECQCDCGRVAEVTEDALVQKSVMSCGCLRNENRSKICEKLHRIDGTCVEILEKRKSRKDNTSGFRGVFRTGNGKYRVNIGFKGQRFYLGTYQDYGEAVKVRLQAEELIHGGFLEAYYRWKEKAASDPSWALRHPLEFEVEKKEGELVINGSVKETVPRPDF